MSSTSSRKRAIYGFKPDRPIQEQVDEIKKLSENLQNSLKFDDKVPSEPPLDAMNIYVSCLEKLNNDLWCIFRSAFRQNEKDLIEEKLDDFMKQMKSFGDNIKKYTDSLKNYVEELFQNCHEKPIIKDSLTSAFDTFILGITKYFEQVEKYKDAAEKIRAKDFVETLTKLSFITSNRIIQKLVALIDAFASAVYQSYEEHKNISILKRNKKGEMKPIEKYKNNREESINIVLEFFGGKKSPIIELFSRSISCYPTKYPNSKKEEKGMKKKTEKEHEERKEIFGKLIDVINTEKSTLTSFINRADDQIKTAREKNQEKQRDAEEEEEEAEDPYESKNIEAQTSIIINLFNIIFNNLRDLMKICKAAGEEEQVSLVSENLNDLLIQITNSEVQINYEYYGIFYNEAMEMGEKSSANSIQQTFIANIEDVIEEINNLYKDEEDCTVFAKLPTNDTEAGDMKENADDVRSRIKEITDVLIPTLIQASKTFSTYNQEDVTNDEDGKEQARQEPEDEEETENPFSDLLLYFYELSYNHINELSTDTDLLESAFSDSRSQASTIRLTMTELEARRSTEEQMKNVRKNVIQEAIIGTKNSLILVIRAMIVEKVLESNFDEAKERCKDLTSIISSNNKALLVMKKQANKDMDVEKVEEIDTMIARNSKDARSELLDCFDEATREMIMASISNYNINLIKFKDMRDKIIQTQDEQLNTQLAYVESELHIPQLILLEKKLIIETERQKKRTIPEIEAMKQRVMNLTQQGDFQAARKHKEEVEKAEICMQEKQLEELQKKQDEKRKKLIGEQTAQLKKLEDDYKTMQKKANSEYNDNVLSLKKNLASAVNGSITLMVNKSILLMSGFTPSSSSEQSPRSQKLPTKEGGYSRKELFHRFELIAKDVLKQNDLLYVLDQ